MEPTEGYEVIGYVPAKILMYNQPGTCYTLVALSEEDPTAGKQSALFFPVLLLPTFYLTSQPDIYSLCVGAALSDAEHDLPAVLGAVKLFLSSASSLVL